jgi:hypothetical protein
MPMKREEQTRFAGRNFIVYFLLLLFTCLCMSILVSQRLRIARCGERIITLHEEAARLRSEQSHLRLGVAQQSSYHKLQTRAREMAIKLVPPEEAVAVELAGDQ